MARIAVADHDRDALDLALVDRRLEVHEVHGPLDAAGVESRVGTLSPDAVDSMGMPFLAKENLRGPRSAVL